MRQAAFVHLYHVLCAVFNISQTVPRVLLHSPIVCKWLYCTYTVVMCI